ncbi:carboxypeptidase-like regulatory domain-containing protein [Flavobacterium sp. MAHUQ-51]|uniref:carboxypeptidase-like regulatory domain-containing protein n=1 Tax=Flavobacterium sp. GCM10022190 TaxID=3252639 RepID=UPI0036149218
MDNQDKIFTKIKNAAQNAEQQDFPAMDKVWARVEEKLDKKEDKKAIVLWKKLAITASLLLFVSLGYQFLKTDSQIEAPTQSIQNKVVLQKNEITTDSVLPSENIKAEASEILQKQLSKKNPVVSNETTIKTPDEPCTAITTTTVEVQQLSDTSSIQKAPDYAVVALKDKMMSKSLAPTTSELKETAKMAVADQKTVKTITGVIVDEKDNLPIPGAVVQIKGKNKGTVTDLEGKYSIEAEKGEQLIFSTIGYKNAYATVSKSNELNTKLSPSSDALNEVVVVGYGTARKKQAKNAAPIAKYGTTKFYKNEKVITVPHIKDALYIINEEEYPEASLFGSNVTSPYAPLSEQKIESLKVLSKKESIAKYGEKGKNKVIIITTKNGIPLKR